MRDTQTPAEFTGVCKTSPVSSTPKAMNRNVESLPTPPKQTTVKLTPKKWKNID